jgi:hypothetical protein
LKFVSVKALARPSDRVHRFLHNWMIDNRPLLHRQDDFIHQINDLVLATKRDEYNTIGSRMDAFIEKVLAGDSNFIHVWRAGGKMVPSRGQTPIHDRL